MFNKITDTLKSRENTREIFSDDNHFKFSVINDSGDSNTFVIINNGDTVTIYRNLSDDQLSVSSKEGKTIRAMDLFINRY